MSEIIRNSTISSGLPATAASASASEKKSCPLVVQTLPSLSPSTATAAITSLSVTEQTENKTETVSDGVTMNHSKTPVALSVVPPPAADPLPSGDPSAKSSAPLSIAAPSSAAASNWCAIPNISNESLTRKFEVDLPNIEVTSLDMTPHGCFVLAGCSNGMVLLFDLTSSSK
jgi:hypothetical protein